MIIVIMIEIKIANNNNDNRNNNRNNNNRNNNENNKKKYTNQASDPLLAHETTVTRILRIFRLILTNYFEDSQ